MILSFHYFVSFKKRKDIKKEEEIEFKRDISKKLMKREIEINY